MNFFECEFPTTLSYRAIGGSRFFTTVNEGFSGYEQRNQNWSQSRGKWTVSLQTPSSYAGDRQSFIDLLHAFFLVVAGKAGAFRLKDHKDFQATGQTLGTGLGAAGQVFQLVKAYTVAGQTYVRNIVKPIAPPAVDYENNTLSNTVNIYFNSVLQSSSDWSVDCTTGLVTIPGVTPLGTVVTADCQFHFPVRFDTDEFPGQIEESDISGAGPLFSLNSIPLVEVRL